MRPLGSPLTGLSVIDWRESPNPPRLADGELHLWRADLESFPQSAQPGRLLSADERAKFSRLVFPEKRKAFAASRAALRIILAKYIDLPPAAIRFGYHALGKPCLTELSFGNALQFNLSHSNHWMILGICKNAHLGVDIEELRPVNDAWAVKNLFSTQDQKRLCDLSGDEKAHAFIAAWTKKEAAAKADGAGMGAYSLKGRWSPSQTGCSLIKERQFYLENPFWFMHLEPAPGYLATIAIQSAAKPSVKYFKFSLGYDPLINMEATFIHY